MSSLEVRNVHKIYEGDVEAVKGVSFFIENGEFIAILGPSGCGKSSTLRMIAGLEEVSHGEILFDGKVINNLTPAQRNVALAFESYALYSPLNVYENLAFPLKAKGMDRKKIYERIIQTAEMFELTGILKKKPCTLSGGQQQRVSLARALVRDPNIFLLDEPLSHMDQRNRADIRTRIRYIHDRQGVTTIYVTHDQEEAISLADRVLVMNDGAIQQFGPVDELWNRPANLFVAGFIGEPAINFVPGVVGSKRSVALIPGMEGSVRWLVERNLANVPVGSAVIIGFRPNKTEVSTFPSENGLKARINIIEFLGGNKQLTVGLNKMQFRVLVPVDMPVAISDDVWLNVKPENINIFNKLDGRAV